MFVAPTTFVTWSGLSGFNRDFYYYLLLLNQVTTMIRKAKSSYDHRIAEKKFRSSQELLESCEESPSPNPNKSVTPQPSASSWVYHSTWKNNHACPYYCERFLLKVSAVVSASILQMLWRNCFLTFHLRTGTN